MATHGRGLICMPMTPERLDALEIPLMVRDNTSVHETAFCVSVEAKHGVTTGISAADRARTVRVAIAGGTEPGDLVRPGHVFPLRSRPGGVLQRAGQTEAGVDLARPGRSRAGGGDLRGHERGRFDGAAPGPRGVRPTATGSAS